MKEKTIDQIMEGLNEALAIVKDEANPTRTFCVSSENLTKRADLDKGQLDASENREPYILKRMTAQEFVAAIAKSAPISYPEEMLPLGEWIARLIEEDHCTVTADEFRKLVGIEPAWSEPAVPYDEAFPELISAIKKNDIQ